ncbi:N-acetylmuramoyl-L-alanine amidase family protein [Paenibacillus kobensis]|uniref:N-acetylmuramoyl-L-alanine amidase family protein n=1 Tax=Paenibacillus kobensis TaxID=59841 RepID=UPI000FD72645|nr:N-acetylmuramoyl-L-alanine amidase family protein [Paenibacillus kobensis]
MKTISTTLLGMAVFFLLFAGIVPNPTAVAAEDRYSLYLDGRLLNADSPPQLVNNTMLVPLRIVSEELGADVIWNQAQKLITVHKDDLNLQLGIDKKEALVNGQTQLLDAAPLLMNKHTLIPVRFVSENLGLIVKWDSQTQSVLLKSTSTASTNAADSASDKKTLPDINGIGLDGNILKITTSGGSIQPAVSEMSEPARLIVDIPGAALGRTINGQENGGKGGKIFLDHPYVSNIRYSLFQAEPSTVRIVLDLKQEISYEAKAGEVANEWLLSLNGDIAGGETASIESIHPIEQMGSSDPVDLLDPSTPVIDTGSIPTQLPEAGQGQYKVVIDAGHGGTDVGTIAASGKYEKDFNLPMALKVADLLGKEKRISVYLTRNDDTYPGLDDRVKMANEWKADIFVSIHGNSYTENRNVVGTETHYTRDDSKPLAQIIHRHLLAGTGFKDRGIIQNNLLVTKKTTMPAVLLEVGFLSNSQQEQAMWDEQFQWKVAQSIVDGIKEYLGVN